jgi:WD40 repeat protein
MTDPPQIHRRHFIAIATATYAKSPQLGNLPVSGEVDAVRGWLTSPRLRDRAFDPDHTELADDPNEDQIRAVFKDPRTRVRWRWKDAAVLYITGHGVTDEQGKHFLVLKDTDVTELGTTGFATADLFVWLADTRVDYLVVIVDACFAGQVAEEAAGRAKDHWLILPSATKEQRAQAGALADAISGFVRDGAKYNRDSPYLPVGVFTDALKDRLGPDQYVQEIYKGGYFDEHACLPNPHYEPTGKQVKTESARRALALPEASLAVHNRSSAPQAGSDAPGWLFTGRAALMRELIRAAAEPGVTLITGSAGCGKTAALSRLVTLSDPVFHERHGSEVAGISPALLPPPEAIDAAVSAREKSPAEVLVQLCRQLKAPVPKGGEIGLERRYRFALTDHLRSSVSPATIVVDALDEAQDSDGLVRNVLGPLSEAVPGLCLLVGVRSPEGQEGVSGGRAGAEPPPPDLLDMELGTRRIRVDQAPWWDEEDIAIFTRNILMNTTGTPYQQEAADDVGRLAAVIGAEARRSYLVAEKAAEILAGLTAAVAPNDPALLSALRRGLFGVFHTDLHVSVRLPEERHCGVALLRAVAFARGAGLPWNRLWARMASAVDGEREYGDGDVKWLLKSRLNAYLITDLQDGLTVYRLSHGELEATLRNQWQTLLEDPPGLPGGEGTPPPTGEVTPPLADEDEIFAVEARITLGLHSLAVVRATVACDRPPPPYVRRHFAEHALAGGLLDKQNLPDAFLPYLDLPRLRSAIGAAARQRLDEALPLLPVLRQVVHLWDWNQPARNAAAIEMWAALAGAAMPGPADSLGPVGGPWRLRWAVGSQNDGSQLGWHHGELFTMAMAEVSGTPIAVVGQTDGRLVAWNLSTGAPHLEPITTEDGAIRSVATLALPDGRVLAVTGSADGRVRAWDLRSGGMVGRPMAGGEELVAVTAAVLPDGRPVAAVADQSGMIRTWDLITAAPVGDPLRGEPEEVLGLATAQVGGRVLGLATGSDSGLWVWDLATGIPLGDRLTEHPAASVSGASTYLGGPGVAATVLGGLDVAITGNGDGLLFWDLGKMRHVGRRLAGNEGKVRSLAVVRPAADRVIAVTGGDKAVRVWDLTAAWDQKATEPPGELLVGHHGSVEAVGVMVGADGTAIAVSASRDKTVRLYDVAAEAVPVTSPSFRWLGNVGAVAATRLPDGRAIAVTVSGSALHIWDLLVGGDPLPLTGHERAIVSAATVTLPGGAGVLVVAADWDGKIHAWSAADGSLAGSGRVAELSSITCLATATLMDGRTVAVLGLRDGLIRVWDLSAHALARPDLACHAHAVAAVAIATATDGRTLVISGGRDRHIQILDLDACLDPASPGPPPIDIDFGEEITALAVTPLLDGAAGLVAGGSKGTVGVLSLPDGVPAGKPWRACPGAVRAVAAGRLDGRLLALTGGEEPLVQAWDISSARPVGAALPTPGPARAMALLCDPIALVVGGAGVAVARPLHNLMEGSFRG